jgi:predicted alpha/beta superfamily hydrolase
VYLYYDMIRVFSVFVLLAWGCIAHTKKQPGDIVVAYPFAKDSFLVRINDLAANAGPGDTIHVVYYADGSLKSGKQMEAIIEKYRTELSKKNYVFAGIAHFGQYRVKRRRDFISPSVRTAGGYKGSSDNYGQADSFYYFLQHTIMPLAEKKFSGHIIERSFIGHSLGGLFAAYLLVNGDSLFNNLYALSPALWIDGYHILDYESSQQDKLNKLEKNIWISCGSRETFNRIKTSVDRIRDTLHKRKYTGIGYTVKMYEGKTHNSSVGPTLEEIAGVFLKE